MKGGRKSFFQHAADLTVSTRYIFLNFFYKGFTFVFLCDRSDVRDVPDITLPEGLSFIYVCWYFAVPPLGDTRWHGDHGLKHCEKFLGR